MTLYYSLVFLLLVVEIVVFMTLIVPLPHSMQRKLFTFISENPIIAKIQYGLKITFIFVLILFVDSVNRVYRVQLEIASAHKEGRGAAVEISGSARMEVQARKFYSQRNMYLCGFTLFLSLILNRTYVMMLDILRLEDEVKTLKGDPNAKTRGSSKAGESAEVARLKKELETARRDVETMKKQSQGLQAEYNRLGDEKSPVNSTPKKDR